MPQIPAGWEETTLGKACIVMSWSTPSTKEELYRDWDISWITPKDLSNYNERYIAEGERNITEAWVKNSSAQILPPNTILFSSRAPIWYVAIAKKELTTNQGFKNIICDEKESHYLFFYYWLKYRSEYIEKISSGSTFTEASAAIMRSLPIHRPPLPEQQAIAAVLSSFDDKIELLRAENQTLEQMGQELFKERFGKWKVGDELPEGWRVGKIEDLTNYIASWGTPATKEASYYGWRINWFSTKELQDCFLFSSEKTITEDALKNSSAKEFPKDTVLMAIYAAPTVWRLWILTQSSAFNQAAVGLVAKDDIWMPFIYLLLKFHRDNFNNLANWAAQQNLNVSLVKNYEIIIPDQETLNQFDLVIKPLFNKIRENSEQIQNLSATRDQLLPKLMSGEVRVEF